jgi:magnesium transporter
MNDVEMISDMLQNLETHILNFSPNKGMAKELQYARKLLIQLGKSTFPIKEKLGRLSTGENKFIRPENLLYFQDVKDHIIYVVQVISDNKEMLRSLEDLYLAGNDLRMNQIMQRLTVISTIFIPLTFLVGLWGMNFTSMPEIHWQYGYLFAWGIILLVAILTVWFLKRYKWF